MTSPVTLTECLVLPVKSSSEALLKKFATVIVRGPSVEFVPLDEEVARRVAEIPVVLVSDLTE